MRDRNLKLAFFVPFFVGGAIFSFLACQHISRLPDFLHPQSEYLVAILVSYFTMGTTCGLTALCFATAFYDINDVLRGCLDRKTV